MVRFEKTVDGIYVLKVPFSGVWTGVVLVRGEKNFLIDSGVGTPDDCIVPALRELGVDPREIDWLLHTHGHGDHITCHRAFVDAYGTKVAAFEKSVGTLRDPAANAVRIRTKFPEYSPKPQSWLRGVETDRVLRDGEVLEGRLKVISTPGHDDDCVCWLDLPTGTLITGDSLQGNGTPVQGIGFYQSLGKYLATLDRLEKENAENILCAHEYDGIGWLVRGRENVKEALRRCRSYTEEYETRLRRYVEEGMTDDAEMTVRLIREVGCGTPESLFLALYTVNEHLNGIRR